MNNISKSLMILFFILTGCDVHAIQFSTNSEFEVIYEQKFDKKIDEVAFDSYEKDGSIMYYPKIVVFKERDDFTVEREYKHERYDDKKVFRKVNKEIRIFSPKGSMRTSIQGSVETPFQSEKIYISEGGNYFAVLQRTNWDYFYSDMTQLYFPRDKIRKMEKENEEKFCKLVREKFEAEYGKLEETNLSVYNDEGKMLWRKEPWELPYDSDYTIFVSPKNGNILYGEGVGYSMTYKLYNSEGFVMKNISSQLYGYFLPQFTFSENWKYIGVGYMELPPHFYQKLPGKSSNPGIILLDSTFTVIWKKPLEGYLMDWVIISPKGSYVGGGTHTMKGLEELREKRSDSPLAQSGGFLFNKEGNFVMNLPWLRFYGFGKVYSFSNNENYLACSIENDLRLIDIDKKKEIMSKKFPNPISSVSVSNNGKVFIVTKKTEKIYGKHGYNLFLRFFVVDRSGNSLWESNVIEGIFGCGEYSAGSSIKVESIDWVQEDLIVGITDKKNGKSVIAKIITEEKK